MALKVICELQNYFRPPDDACLHAAMAAAIEPE
jgi:hypothetical protein